MNISQFRRLLLLLIILNSVHLFMPKRLSAQHHEVSGWGAWFHSQRLSPHWGILFDAQFRTADKFAYLRSPLIRPAVSYYFDNRHFASVGYLFTGVYRKTDEVNTFRPEQRIWEQYIVTHKAGLNTQLQHRFRLEQRFVGQLNTNTPYFAQRLRYFIRGIIPFGKDSVFNKGTYVALQNEAFANVQNKAKINNSLFDQNRAYISFGYRLSKMADIEAGYLNQYINTVGENTMNHIVQIAMYTRL